MKSINWLIPVLLSAALLTACGTNPSQIKLTEASSSPNPTSTLSNTSTIEPPAAPTNTPAGTWINLLPASGTPGSTVKMEGYLPGGLPLDQLKQENYLTYTDICWGGCTDGLVESAIEVDWSKTDFGYFSLQFVVPSVPWLASDGIHKLTAGDYPVSLRQLNPNETCVPSGTGGKDCSAISEISSTFKLTEGYSGSECQDISSCGWSKITPGQGAPGETIQVHGWAPLISIIGQPFGYYLDLEIATDPQSYSTLSSLATPQQSMDGTYSVSFQVPQYVFEKLLSPGNYTLALQAGNINEEKTAEKNTAPVLLAPAQLQVTAAPDWTARQRSAPLWIQPIDSFLNESLSIDPIDSQRLAYCVTGSILSSKDGGQSWDSIPTDSIKDIPLPGDLVMDSSSSSCQSVTLDSTHLDSYYAVFSAASKQWGAPPDYFLGFFTSDRGKTWQLVPVTQLFIQSSNETGSFGGFYNNGKVVQALYYAAQSDNSSQSQALQVKQTDDGGVTWTSIPLDCPSTGICLRWGGAPSEISGMGSGLPQEVIVSFDNGQRWSATGQSAELRMPGPQELVALSQDEDLILSGNANYPVLYTPDGGKTWQALALPSLPGSNSGWMQGYSGLQMLADGSLAAMNQDNGTLWILGPHSQTWCSTSVTLQGNYPALLRASEKRILWFSTMTDKIESASISELSCKP